jgi:site-specific DNA recombinase
MTTRRKTTTRRREAITPETTLRVAIYTRRSTDDEHQPYTIEAQTQKLQAYVDSQPGRTIAATFTDDASGATLDRPGLAKALVAARAGKYDLLLVYRLDRFSRRIRDLATLMDELDAANVHFRSATEPFDTTSAAGRLFVQMLGAFAEFEREVIIDRVINGMERKAAKGEWTHGPRPYGYLVDPATHRLVPHEQEQHVVREIFTRYATTRVGTRAIADTLNEQGSRTRHGKPWSGLTIGRMLGNRLYLGEVAFREITAADAHPAIVEPDLFEECQRILDARGKAHSKRAASNSDYRLTWLITCPRCGSKYVGTAAHAKLRRYRYYTCFSGTRYGAAGCDGARIDADLLDQAIQQALIDFYSRTDIIDAAIAAKVSHRAEGGHQREEELKAITGQITTTQAAIDWYLTAFENGTLDERACGHRVRDLTIKLDQLGARRDELIEQAAVPLAAPSARAIQRLRDDLAAVFAHGTPGQRKAVIETHVAAIKIDGNRLIPIFKIPIGNDHGPAETSTDPGVRTTHHVVDLMAPYSNHLDHLKTAQIVLAMTGSEMSITDEPDFGLLVRGNPYLPR